MKNSKILSLFGRMGKLQRLFLIALLSVLAIGAAAQSKTVSGTVVDQTGEPVIGANVLVKGTTNGVITDLDGRFTLSNVPNNGTISISFIGYKDQEISVAGKTNFQVTLQEDNAMLDEVVVVGYGVQKKSDVTGALVSVGAEQLTSRPVNNAFEALQGKAAGVDIPAEAIREGFEHVVELTGLMGRWQVLQQNPKVVCDTGHNAGGWQYLQIQLDDELKRHKHLYMIVGMVNDKDINSVLELMPKEAFYFFTQASVQRAMPAEGFAALAVSHGLSGVVCDSVPSAIEKALARAGQDDMIFIGGSTFIVADALPLFLKENE